MRTMSGSPCLHYDCSNRNSFGYCKTTVCINEHYQQEQWGLPSTKNKTESVVIKQPSAQPDLQPTCNQLATDCISRQEAIDAILECCTSDCDNEYECGYDDGLRKGVHKLKHFPSADAVEVVRCKYCEHWKREENQVGEIGDDYFCAFDQNKSFREDFFCADGERRRSE